MWKKLAKTNSVEPQIGPRTLGHEKQRRFSAARCHLTPRVLVLTLTPLPLSQPAVPWSRTTPEPFLIAHMIQPTFWELSNWQVFGAAGLLILAGVIIWLLLRQAKRKEAEIEIRQAGLIADAEHKGLMAIMSTIPGIVWESRTDPVTGAHRTTFVSDYAEEMLGYSPQQWMSTPGFALSLIHEEDRERVRRAADEVIAGKSIDPIQFRWIAKDGHVVWAETRLTRFVDSSGRLVGVRGVTLDISEKKLAELARQESDRRNRAILQAIPDLMFLQTRDGVYLDYHAQHPEDLLVPPDKFLGKNMRDVLPPKLADDFAQLFERAKPGETQVLEYELLLNGMTKSFEARVVLTKEHVLSVVRDTTHRKSIENALGQNESAYRAIFNAANDAIFVHDARTGQIVDANLRMSELYGWTLDEVRDLSVGDLSSNEPPFTKEAALIWVQKAAAGEPQLFEWRAKDKSGRLFWVEVNLKSAILLGQHVVLAVVRDITARKQALDDMQQSEERFGKAFRANPQPMSLTTLAEGIYLDVNDSFLAMSGFARDEVIGHSSLELRNWEKGTDRAGFIERIKAQGSIVNYQLHFRTKDGSLRVLLVSAELLKFRGQECMLVASSDITEFVHAQQALRESEERFRNMADNAPVLIWVADQSGSCTYFNKQWLDFTGRRLEEELGFGWSHAVHPDDLAHCLETYKTSFDKRTSFQMEYRLRRKDGEFRWILDCGTPRFSSDRAFLGFIGSSIDITDRKESEVALHQAHEELSELKNRLEAENIYLHQELQLDQTFGDIVGQSDAIKYVLFKVKQVAPTDSTVLITGETGTGKELVARAIHATSSRKDQPLIKVNCAALSPTLIESELFGHEKGAFTGATARKLGRFELANDSTIFLDEIGELPPDLQVKLLRVIQEGEFERVGGTKTLKVDARIITATNRNLKLAVENGTFREDLWYRLNVFPITVPPLRQRKEDIPSLVESFVNKFAKKFGKTIVSVSPRAMQSLQTHSWPGNVRELANVIERAVIHNKGAVLHGVERLESTPEETTTLKTLEETERDYIIRVLEDTGWRIEGKYGASRILGLNPSTLRTRMVKLGIQRRASHPEKVDLPQDNAATASHES